MNLDYPQWQYRWPFFTTPTPFEIRSDSQAVMDQEIDYASSAGPLFKYWAFLYDFGDPSGIGLGLQLYRSSTKKSQINFALIPAKRRHRSPNFGNIASEVVGLMGDPSYQKVLGNRPLVYAFASTSTPSSAYASAFQTLRQGYTAQYGANPYIVLMTISIRRCAVFWI